MLSGSGTAVFLIRVSAEKVVQGVFSIVIHLFQDFCLHSADKSTY